MSAVNSGQNGKEKFVCEYQYCDYIYQKFLIFLEFTL